MAKVVIRLDPHKRVNTVVMVNGKGRCWPGRGLDVEHATDVLMRIYGESSDHLMTSERGWSHERFIELAVRRLTRPALGDRRPQAFARSLATRPGQPWSAIDGRSLRRESAY